ncbi:pseudouridine synthase [Aureococcus anophagefferens]|uniref:Pseudouridine synthase n=1 Tax=Aureococcus anophagefferens TaxID=44056 RepID=A0ABR1GAH5_AURAN
MAEPSAATSTPAIRILHEDDHIVVVDKPTNLLSVPGRHPDAPPPTKKRRRVAEFWVEALEASRASSPPESLAAKLLGVGDPSSVPRRRDKFGRAVARARALARNLRGGDADALWAALDGDARARERARSTATTRRARCRWRARPLACRTCASSTASTSRRAACSRVREDVRAAALCASFRADAAEASGAAATAAAPKMRKVYVAAVATGRSHQLRVHCLAAGHPIVGDPLYGPPPADHEPRLCLHAAELDLTHPGTGDRVTFASPAPF